MRTILILIKREIIDHVGYFVSAAVVAGLMVALIAAMSLNRESSEMSIVAFGAFTPLALVLVTGMCALGVAQMHTDRTRNVSAFLMALPVTRSQLFAARVAAGLLAVLVLILPPAVAAVVLLDFRRGEVPLYAGIVADVFWSIFLACFACYSVGLYAGWNRRSLTPTLAVLPILVLVPALVVIKGFGVDLVAVVSLFIVSCLAATWCRFSASSL